MTKWIVFGGIAFVAYLVYSQSIKPYRNAVATGWAGNAAGNMPALWNPTSIVGKGIGGATSIFGGPGTQYGPSLTTNSGSYGG